MCILVKDRKICQSAGRSVDMGLCMTALVEGLSSLRALIVGHHMCRLWITPSQIVMPTSLAHVKRLCSMESSSQIRLLAKNQYCALHWSCDQHQHTVHLQYRQRLPLCCCSLACLSWGDPCTVQQQVLDGSCTNAMEGLQKSLTFAKAAEHSLNGENCCLPSSLAEKWCVPVQATMAHRVDQKGVVGAVRVACRSLSSKGLRRSLEDQASPRHLFLERRSADSLWRRSLHQRQTL